MAYILKPHVTTYAASLDEFWYVFHNVSSDAKPIGYYWREKAHATVNRPGVEPRTQWFLQISPLYPLDHNTGMVRKIIR